MPMALSSMHDHRVLKQQIKPRLLFLYRISHHNGHTPQFRQITSLLHTNTKKSPLGRPAKCVRMVVTLIMKMQYAF